MNNPLKAIALALLLTASAIAQAAAPSPPTFPADPLGRSTPRGTVLGFAEAAHSRDFNRAAQYLDVRPGEQANTLSRQLSLLLDRGLAANLERISDSPDGAKNENLPLQRDRIGRITAGNEGLDILLDRVPREGRLVWLFSRETLRGVPEMDERLNSPRLEDYLPAPLRTPGWMGMPLWKWIGLLLIIGLAVALSIALRRIAASLLLPVVRAITKGRDDELISALIGPLRILVVLGFLQMAASLLILPFLVRVVWSLIGKWMAILALTWLFIRVVRLIAELMRRRIERTTSTDTTAVVRLVTRTTNLLAACVAVLLILRTTGYDVTAVLAGFGVGGIAIAFAAQKTIENLFGSISIIFDKPIRVGDYCRIADKTGTIEDIGLRSTRVRTLDRTMLTVPNGQLSTMMIENFGLRDKIWFHHKIGIATDSSADQLRQVLDSLSELLAGNPKVLKEGARATLIGIALASIEIELFAYIDTMDFAEFLQIQQELLLQALEIVEKSGAKAASSATVVNVTPSPSSGTP